MHQRVCQKYQCHIPAPYAAGTAILDLDTKILMSNFQEFIDYVFSFYGEGGLYPLNVTKEQIALATLKYLDNCAFYDQQDKPWTSDYKVMKWGDGDSLDRERVRDELIDMYQIDWEACMPVQKLSTVPRKGDFFMP